VVADVLQLADYYYRSADRGMRAIPLRCRTAILVASRVYRALGVKLRRHRYDARLHRHLSGLPGANTQRMMQDGTLDSIGAR
jgi:phytoene/squalene synthetase